jgi:transcriptional regulator with XRE-family HTH domain
MGQKLKVLRNHRGVSLRQLAKLTDLSPSRISRIERGLKEPKIYETEIILFKLGYSSLIVN